MITAAREWSIAASFDLGNRLLKRDGLLSRSLGFVKGANGFRFLHLGQQFLAILDVKDDTDAVALFIDYKLFLADRP